MSVNAFSNGSDKSVNRNDEMDIELNDDDEDDVAGYVWEKDAERTWETLKEKEGRLTFGSFEKKKR